MMRKFVVGMVAILAIALIVSACKDQREIKGYVDREKVVHDTVYIDSFIVEKHDTVFYDGKWLRNAFENAKKKTWTDHKDSISVDYPDFMKKKHDGERSFRVEYNGITMVADVYDDEQNVSVSEKYDAINLSAVTKSMGNRYFLMAGGVGDYKSFFEKDIKVKERTWMYLRVEFPKELTWAVDPLLQYVLNYELKSKNPDEPMIIIKPAEIPS
jgi:hypothetical protein